MLPFRDATSDFIAHGESPDMIGRAESQRLNGHGRLASARGDDEIDRLARLELASRHGSRSLQGDKHASF